MDALRASLKAIRASRNQRQTDCRDGKLASEAMFERPDIRPFRHHSAPVPDPVTRRSLRRQVADSQRSLTRCSNEALARIAKGGGLIEGIDT
jgi:hypothetical protein